jgi:hypothetical protein
MNATDLCGLATLGLAFLGGLGLARRGIMIGDGHK